MTTTSESKPYVMTCLRKNFVQCIDVTRPHTLLTTDVKLAGSLEYRYDDTQEVVVCPNLWYNQPYPAQVARIRREADIQRTRATDFIHSSRRTVTHAGIYRIVAGYQERAARIDAEADRVEALGDKAYPVAATALKLDYGDIVDSLVRSEERIK